MSEKRSAVPKEHHTPAWQDGQRAWKQRLVNESGLPVGDSVSVRATRLNPRQNPAIWRPSIKKSKSTAKKKGPEGPFFLLTDHLLPDGYQEQAAVALVQARLAR